MPDRYAHMPYRRCGTNGLKLPAISLGCWHNFGEAGSGAHGITDEAGFHARARELIVTAFDHGITHIDFANNYGPPPGAAEERAGRILRELPRDELIVSSKAGYRMWPGPYGDGGSRKYLVASCEASLRRLGLDYVDLFYHHRPDPETPLEETLGALDHLVRCGRALYVGVSNYPADLLERALAICEREGFARPIIHQPKCNLLERGPVDELFPTLERSGLGSICFSPLAQGLLTGKYLDAVPADSRAGSGTGFLKAERITPELQQRLRALAELARDHGFDLAQFAIRWLLHHDAVTSTLIGASRPEQITDLVQGLDAAEPPREVWAQAEAIADGNTASG